MILLTILGNTNTPNGELSSISIERLTKALETIQSGHDYKIVTTGSFGLNFNTHHIAHGKLMSDRLMEMGVSHDLILPHIKSTNTIEDIHGIRKILNEGQYEKTTIITSDFHMKRVKIIVDHLDFRIPIDFITCKTHLPKQDLKILLNREREAVKKLLENRWIIDIRQ